MDYSLIIKIIFTLSYVTETNSQKSKMSAISMLNPKAEVARAAQALAVNISGAKVGFVSGNIRSSMDSKPKYSLD